MWDLNYSSVKEIMAVLDENGLAMSKKFGQNFLIDKYAREAIASSIGAKEGMKLWEIGPGLGAITSLVVQTKADLKVFEIDNGFCKVLSEKAFRDDSNFTLIQGDALKTIPQIEGVPDVIYGNLPYNVGSVIIASLIESSILPEKMVFTLQKEVVDRMTAKAGDDNYSSFSLLTQLDYENKLSQIIRKGCFYPEPKVESAVVVMAKRETPMIPSEYRETFLLLVRDLFAQRRKNIRNNLLSGYVGKKGGKQAVETVLEKSGFSGSERAETFGFEEFFSITKAVKESV
ncbi:MAG: 16S rRNA (adenine(1518)-N(6)/adenine(1519)-N(6))-dimethyltransferase RsmA [Sphaerochaetaceae bacterium]|nr:16S rRNA (adenine(1518)-N(6)/adenine(1519)-N(6))-dimethyltransferase RsmA [Sphaerochaetaceae bacterium]